MRLILEGDRKLIVCEKRQLIADAVAQRVEHLAAGIDRLVAGESLEEVVADRAQGVGDDEPAEPGPGGAGSARLLWAGGLEGLLFPFSMLSSISLF